MINPDILARINLTPTLEGGRRIPTQAHGRYGVPLKIDGELYDSWILLDGIGPLLPGNSYENVPVKFGNPDAIKPLISIGYSFDLWEFRIDSNDWGVVGAGTVSHIY